MQTRSFSRAFRNTLARMWWVPFLFAAIAGPVAYTIHELDGKRFSSSGLIRLDMPDGSRPSEAVIKEHELMLESQVRLQNAKASLMNLGPEAAFMDMSIDAAHRRDTAIIKVTCIGKDASLVRKSLHAQMRHYMLDTEFLKRKPSAESTGLDLAKVNPQVLEWPGPAMEKLWPGVMSGFRALLLGGAYGVVCMLLFSGLWAFFRPAWVQPSLDEIMKAVEALDPTTQAILLVLLEGGASGEAGSRGTT
jgi:hypothetical protein